MKLSMLSKFPWVIFFWLGPILVIAGVSAGLVATFSAIPIAMVSVGVVIIGGWLVVQSLQPAPVDTPGFWDRRSTQSGTNAIVATMAMILLLGMVNFLGTRYSTRIDLTEAQLYTLYPQSQEVVKNLKQPVKAWVFFTSKDPQDEALLENYRKQNPAFTFEFVDPQARPALVQKFGVKAQGDVYLEAGDRRQYVQTINAQERLSEAKMTTALEQIGRDRQDKAYFLQGHGEYTPDQLSQAYSFLVDKNFVNEPLNLAERLAGGSPDTAIPADANVVVIAGPKRAFFKSEVEALRAFLNRGGGLMVLVDPNTNPELDALLNEWGVKLDPRLVIDAGGGAVGLSPQGGVVGFGPTAPLVTRYGEHPITKEFNGGNSFYPMARPVIVTPVAGVDSTPLLYTNNRSWAESNIQDNAAQFDQDKDLKGPLTLGVALEKPILEPTPTPSPSPQSSPSPPSTPSSTPTPSPSPSPTANQSPKLKPRMVVIGNSSFVSDGLFGQQLNGDVFLNSVTWLSQRQNQVLSIRPKEAKDRRIVLSMVQGNLVAVIALVVLPVFGLLMAGFLWWRRR